MFMIGKQVIVNLNCMMRKMMFDYKIIPVRNESIDSPYRINGFSEKRKIVSRRFKRDRRRQTRDRRSSIREGVIVNLSFKDNRRKGNDRRRTQFSRFA
jgi:hypothetical protein